MLFFFHFQTKDELIACQEKELQLCENLKFKNILSVLSAPEAIKAADENALVEALESKYDALKDKLILDALEKQMGAASWAEMNERERQHELLKMKLKHKKLQQEGEYLYFDFTPLKLLFSIY